MTTRLKLDQDVVGLSSLMERLTHARVKDCFKDQDFVYFIVNQGEMGKALGKGGQMVKKVQQEIGKRVKVIEFRDDVKDFVRNVIYPLTVEEIVQEGGVVTLKDSSKKTKSLLIGRESRNLNILNRAVKRFFNVEIRII